MRVQAIAVVAAAWLGLACGPSPEPTRPSVVVVSFDALRADATSPYGAPHRVTPHMDAFARRATRFEAAYSPTAKTPSSFAAYLTGRHATDALVDWALPAELPTLAELFAAEIQPNLPQGAALGFAHGFAVGFGLLDLRTQLRTGRIPVHAVQIRIPVPIADRAPDVVEGLELLGQHRDELRRLLRWLHRLG